MADYARWPDDFRLAGLISCAATDDWRADELDECQDRKGQSSVSKKDKKATEESTSPMAEALGQSADEETAKGYFDSLSAEQQLVNATAPALESSPGHLDDDYLHPNFQQYAPGSQAMVDAIADRVVEQLKPFIADAFDEAIARAFADNQED